VRYWALNARGGKIGDYYLFPGDLIWDRKTGMTSTFGFGFLSIVCGKKSRDAAALLAMLMLSGCAQIQPYWKNTASDRHYSVIPGTDEQMAFIEFGEQGSYQDPSQLENVLKLIRTTSHPLVLTYVHGWHNNAAPGNGDVEKFSETLRQLAESAVVQKSGYHVIGVYLGWRGEIITAPLLNELTFYNRKSAAERLASNFDCYDAIAAISEAARADHPEGQYTILMGHSFGGLVVERSVAHAINAEMHGHANPGQSLPADLIVMLNPASDSILTRQMIAALYARHLEDKRQFLVSLTSWTDDATGVLFPLGMGLAAETKVFNQVRAPGPSGKQESERAFYTSTPGHNTDLINHMTVRRPETLANPNHETAFDMNLSHNLTGGVFLTNGTGADTGRFVEWYFKKQGAVDVPYWDVTVDPAIIKDHGDIWNDRAQAMLAAIFRMNIPLQGIEHQPGVAGLKPMVAAPAAQTEPNLHKEPDFNRLNFQQ
jgi:hypothetical protein